VGYYKTLVRNNARFWKRNATDTESVRKGISGIRVDIDCVVAWPAERGEVGHVT
jgi:hypothetical protein